jgi:hypothetical protein
LLSKLETAGIDHSKERKIAFDMTVKLINRRKKKKA